MLKYLKLNITRHILVPLVLNSFEQGKTNVTNTHIHTQTHKDIYIYI